MTALEKNIRGMLIAVSFLATVFYWLLAFGSDIKTTPNGSYAYRPMVIVQEDFLCGTTTTGNLGCNGYSFVNGTVAILAGETGRPGLVRRGTIAVAGTIASLLTNETQNVITYDNSMQITWIARLNTNDANTTVRYGLINSHVANPPTSGIYIEKLDADTNWFCVTRSGGVQTRTDSGIAVSTSFTTHEFVKNSSGVQFKIDNVNVCGVHTTNIPTGVTSIANHIVNSAAAAKTHDIDYSGVIIFGLTR